MSAPRTRKRLIDMIRRTAGLGGAEREGLEDAELWTAHQVSARAMADVERHAERVAATAARQRAQVDAAVESARSLTARGEATSAGVRRLREVLERIDVVALNAGLEGARSSEAGGRALMLVSEELRGLVGRGIDSVREVEGTLGQAATGVTEVGERLDQTQREGASLGEVAALLKTAAQEAQSGLGDLESRLRKSTGLDPETARLIATAGDHARGLASSLSALEGAQGTEAFRALGPLLSPLAKLLSGLPEPESAPRPGERDG